MFKKTNIIHHLNPNGSKTTIEVRKMVLILNEVSFPPDQAHKVGEVFIEWVKNHPPDPSIEKNICIAVYNNANGDVMVLGVGDVAKGKVKEDLIQITEQNLFMAQKIPGLKYNIRPVLSYQEAYKVIGMTAPDL